MVDLIFTRKSWIWIYHFSIEVLLSQESWFSPFLNGGPAFINKWWWIYFSRQSWIRIHHFSKMDLLFPRELDPDPPFPKVYLNLLRKLNLGILHFSTESDPDTPFFNNGSTFKEKVEYRYTISKLWICFPRKSWIWIPHFSMVDLLSQRKVNPNPPLPDGGFAFLEEKWIHFHHFEWWILFPQESWIQIHHLSLLNLLFKRRLNPGYTNYSMVLLFANPINVLLCCLIPTVS